MSLAYGIEGRPGIAYPGGFAGNLKYAERLGNGSWRIRTIDPQTNSGYYPSLSYGPDGRPAISCKDLSSNNIIYAERVISPDFPEIPRSFQVIGITRDPVTKVTTLGWQGTAAAKYDVEFSPSMAAGSWQTLGTNINALDGMTFFRTSSLLGQSNPLAIFRVVRKP